METQMIDMNICWCIIIALIVILFIDSILTTLPIFKVLFTDRINYILIMFLVIFIMLLDLHCGIILGLVILYISMYIHSHKNVISISSTNPAHTSINDVIFKNVVNSNTINSNTINNNTVNNNMSERKVKFDEMKTIINPSVNNNNNNGDNGDNILSESEFIYNNTKPFPNNNLKPFQPPANSSVENNANLVKQKINTTFKNDFITNVGEPDRSGFDITGCRYDMKNSPQNLTKYGPPLAQCSAYDVNKIKTCGTAFYPLNA
jgi:hypothetical protein